MISNTFSVISKNVNNFTVLFRKNSSSRFFTNDDLILSINLYTTDKSITRSRLPLEIEYDNKIFIKECCYVCHNTHTKINDEFEIKRNVSTYEFIIPGLLKNLNEYNDNDNNVINNNNDNNIIRNTIIQFRILDLMINIDTNYDIYFMVISLNNGHLNITNNTYSYKYNIINYYLRSIYCDNKVIISNAMLPYVYYENNIIIIEMYLYVNNPDDVVVTIYNTKFTPYSILKGSSFKEHNIPKIIRIEYTIDDNICQTYNIYNKIYKYRFKIDNGLAKSNEGLEYIINFKHGAIDKSRSVIIYHPNMIDKRDKSYCTIM